MADKLGLARDDLAVRLVDRPRALLQGFTAAAMSEQADTRAVLEAVDYQAELETLSRKIDGLKEAGDTEGLEDVIEQAQAVAAETRGRTRRRARHIRDGAKNALVDVRRGQERTRVEITPISFAIVLVGAAVMLIAVFLPQFDAPSAFAQIQKNTLIQNNDGWWLILLAVAIAGTAWRAYSRRYRTPAPMIMGLVGIGFALYYGFDHSQRQLCSTVLTSRCELGNPGIGIYAAGVGGLLAAIGGFQMFAADRLYESDEEFEDDVDAEPESDVDMTRDLSERLRVLENLHRQGLVTQDEYEQRRSALLNEI